MKLTKEQIRLRRAARRHGDFVVALIRKGLVFGVRLHSQVAAHFAFEAHPELREEA